MTVPSVCPPTCLRCGALHLFESLTKMNTQQIEMNGIEEEHMGVEKMKEAIRCYQRDGEGVEVCPREKEPSSLDAYLDSPPNIKLWPEARQCCVRCGKRSRLYCSDCLLFVGTPTGMKTPTELRLPLEASVFFVRSIF